MAKFNKANLGKGSETLGKDVEPPKATFKASTLNVVVTDDDGIVVLQTKVAPRGYKPKLDKRSNTWSATVGWYGDVRGDDCGEYGGFPVSAGLRFSIAGIKVAPGDEVDLTPDAEPHDADDSAAE